MNEDYLKHYMDLYDTLKSEYESEKVQDIRKYLEGNRDVDLKKYGFNQIGDLFNFLVLWNNKVKNVYYVWKVIFYNQDQFDPRIFKLMELI